ncbi:hypothetical protein BDQ17DRAFT_371851 [Cyathus striatus]|nr:hypothetical protein BDQ17DRAFT_371851 [Cyathus striatus]
MRFMGMNDVLCEASVWKFGRPEKGKKEEKVEKVEEKTEDEKEKEEKEKNKVEEKAEEKTEEKEKEKEDDEDEDENENEEMADVSGLRTDISAIQVELNKLKTHRKKYKFRFNSNVRAVDNRFSSITSSLAPLTPLPGEIKEVREDLEKLVKEVGDVNERVGELREEMWQVSNERDCRALEEEEEREDAKEERDREVVAYALEDMRAAQREMERVTAELDDAKIETVNVRKDVEAKMACLDDSVDAVGKDVKVVGDDVASLKVALDRLKTAAIGLASLLETRHKEGKEYTDDIVRTVRDVGAVTQNLVESHSEKLLNLNREMEGVVHTRLGSLSTRLDKFHVEFDEAKEKEEDRSDHFVRRLSLAEKRLDDMEVDRSDADQTVDDVFARVDDIEALALDERVGAIERHVGEVVARREEVDREREETVRELKGLVAEMRQLREDTQKQMAHDLQSVKAAKELAMVCISKTTQVRISPLCDSPIERFLLVKSFSLKRKRDGVEDAGALSPVGFSAPPTPTPSSAISTAAQDVIMGELTAPVTVLDSEGKVDAATEAVEGGGEDELQGLAPPPRKKAKKVVNVLAQTATALTVGAVATWTALAFS